MYPQNNFSKSFKLPINQSIPDMCVSYTLVFINAKVLGLAKKEVDVKKDQALKPFYI